MRRATSLLAAMALLLSIELHAQSTAARPLPRLVVDWSTIAAPRSALGRAVREELVLFTDPLRNIEVATSGRNADYFFAGLAVREFTARECMNLKASYKSHGTSVPATSVCDASISSIVNDVLNRTVLDTRNGVYGPVRMLGCASPALDTIETTVQPVPIAPETSIPYTVAEWKQRTKEWKEIAEVHLELVSYEPANRGAMAVFRLQGNGLVRSNFRTNDCRNPAPRVLALVPRLPVLTGGVRNGNRRRAG